MSTDLGLNKGDIFIGSDGDLAKVRNTSKLVQDVLKVIHTPIGSNPFFPTLGTNVTIANIGENISQDFAETKVRAGVTKAIDLLQLIQRKQELAQSLTPEEKIAGILDLQANVNPQEPRQYDIKLVIRSASLDGEAILLPTFSLSTTLD